MGTKRNPGKFDCYESAGPDEPMFVLLGRDPSAPLLVELWAAMRSDAGEQPEKVREAISCADAMRVELAARGKEPSHAIALWKVMGIDPSIAALVGEIARELARARAKFPGDNVTMLALMKEVGELSKATFEESRARVRKEAVQVAVMAMRVVLDGDATLDDWRANCDLDPLVER